MHVLARSVVASVFALSALSYAACGAPADGYNAEGTIPAPTPAPAETPSESDAAGAQPAVDSGRPDTRVAEDAGGADTLRDTQPDTQSGPEVASDTRESGTVTGCELPPRDCEGTTSYCGELIPFDPKKGLGYDDYPINGESSTNQYRSYARRDLMILVKYASAYVECKAKGWPGGNGAPLGLGDMSEKSGAIPGTSDGDPAHPSGSHTNGYDMDIAYFQSTGTNNYLRAICPHTTNGYDAYHCTGAPTILDVKRSALFLGALLLSPRTRIIGVDGKVGPLVEPAIESFCADGTLPQAACDNLTRLAWETTDTGRGWFKFHHHHLHVSLKKVLAEETQAYVVEGTSISD